MLIWFDDGLMPLSSCLEGAGKAFVTQREAVFHWSHSLCTSEAHTGRSPQAGHSQYLEWNLFAFEARILSMFLLCAISIVTALR